MRHNKHSRLAGLIVALLPACSPQDEVNAVETSTDATTSTAGATSTGPTGTTTTTAATSTGGATTTTTAASTGATGNTSTASNTSSGGTAGTTTSAPTSTGGSASTGTTASDATSATSGVSTDTGTSGTESVATDTSAGETSEPVVDGIDPTTFAPELDGFYWEGTCVAEGGDARQCAVASSFDKDNLGGCTVNLDKTFSVLGDAATKYVMEIEVRGLLGSRCYFGGERRAGDEPYSLTSPNDGLYIGGTVPGNWWNSYEVHVMGVPQGEPDTFYLNSFYDNPSNSITYNEKTGCTMEELLEIKYTFEVSVTGNSTLLFRINDQNCQAIMNCGPYEGVKTCPTQRTVDLVGMNPPATFEQPPINAVGANLFYPQWAYFDVRSVRVAE